MEWLAPFEVSFVQRALWGGLLVSCLCALAGTWVVVRGMAFLSDAMAHGMLPGVAIAALLGGNLLVGAAFSAAAMAVGVSVLGRGTRFAADTGIGLLFVGMLSAGVIIVSRSPSFAVDLTGFLFGDVLAVRERDLWYLAVAAVVAAVISVLGHRAFVALTFDPRKAQTLGLRPRVANVALIGLVTLAIVASFHIVGTLLVFGLLIAPPAAAVYWVHRIPAIMLTAAALGAVATLVGLLISWHAGTAAGATIAATAVALFFVSASTAWLRERVRSLRVSPQPLTLLLVLAAITPMIGCGTGEPDSPAEPTPHGYVAGAEETGEAQPRLVVADNGTGAVRVIDLVTAEVADLGRMEGVRPGERRRTLRVPVGSRPGAGRRRGLLDGRPRRSRALLPRAASRSGRVRRRAGGGRARGQRSRGGDFRVGRHRAAGPLRARRRVAAAARRDRRRSRRAVRRAPARGRARAWAGRSAQKGRRAGSGPRAAVS
ncbi:zinc ABC transporter permease AztB [Nocardia asiatica]|uniref:zinc ABC transporter permease AztB n=1 Tax=Nocardia asiatica TaxID=209252 RepID=UPI003EE156C3